MGDAACQLHGQTCYSAPMADDKLSANEQIDAALKLDGDPQKVRDYYENWASTYDADVGEAEYSGPRIAARLLSEQLPLAESELLDAGCGTGQVGIELQARGFTRIDGFDLSESMANMARAGGAYREVRGGVDMLQAAAAYAGKSYDAVLSIGVFTLGHVPPEALRVLLELITTDGILILSTRSYYYEQTNFQQVVDAVVGEGRIELLGVIKNAPYNNDGDGHYWSFRKLKPPNK